MTAETCQGIEKIMDRQIVADFVEAIQGGLKSRMQSRFEK